MTRRRTLALSLGTAAALGATSPVAARAQAAAADADNRWSLGIDGAIASRGFKAHGESEGRTTSLDLPTQSLRLGYRATPWLRVELPFRYARGSGDGGDYSSGALGVDADVGRFTANGLRPFVGLGAIVHRDVYATAILVNGELVTLNERTEDQTGLRARAGFEWQASPLVSFRSTLYFERDLERASHGLPRVDEVGLTFGTAAHFGPQATAGAAGRAPRAALPFQIGFGSELTRVVTSALRSDFFDTPTRTRTTFQLPRARVSLMIPVSPSSRALLGAAAAGGRGVSSGGFSSNVIDLSPRAEINLRPDFRTATGLRLGVQADYEFYRATDPSGTHSESQLGGGLDLSLTRPLRSTLLGRVGVGYDYLMANASHGVPAENRLSLKLGVDVM